VCFEANDGKPARIIETVVEYASLCEEVEVKAMEGPQQMHVE